MTNQTITFYVENDLGTYRVWYSSNKVGPRGKGDTIEDALLDLLNKHKPLITFCKERGVQE
jgi:hypothetical protein